MLNPPPHVYTSVGFDRAARFRRDPAWLLERRADPASRVVAMRGLTVFVPDGIAEPTGLALAVGTLGEALAEGALFLGVHEGQAVFALELGEREPPLPGRFVELRTLGPVLPAPEAGLLACARALAHWHTTHRFCGRCGAPTEAVDAGHARRCPACANEVFPRTDPAVIVLVTRGDRCVLGRSPRFPPGMYSTLAGFVEPGESLETTLRREVHEEVGLVLDELVYRSSQPWPFPQSLMLGFRATTRDEGLTVDPDELEDARWFHRAELLDETRRPVRLPAPDSIARFLIEEWLDEAR